jgi:hypothetical protein
VTILIVVCVLTVGEEEKGLALFSETMTDGTKAAEQLRSIRDDLQSIETDILDIQTRQG